MHNFVALARLLYELYWLIGLIFEMFIDFDGGNLQLTVYSCIAHLPVTLSPVWPVPGYC